MPAYRIDIDGRVYEGEYGGRADAVYGALLKDQNEMFRGAGYATAHAELRKPALIGVERLDGRVTKKVHRVV